MDEVVEVRRWPQLEERLSPIGLTNRYTSFEHVPSNLVHTVFLLNHIVLNLYFHLLFLFLWAAFPYRPSIKFTLARQPVSVMFHIFVTLLLGLTWRGRSYCLTFRQQHICLILSISHCPSPCQIYTMVQVEELTPENIHKNPKLLLHKSEPNKRRLLSLPGHQWDWAFQAQQFNDGFRGAMLPNSNFFVISPNCGMLQEPPLGLNREVYMRHNYKYSKDDPLSWPQLYCPEYSHLACICTPPWNSSPSNLFYPLFAPVTRSIFCPCAEHSIVPNIGKLASIYLEKLKATCINIMKAACCIDKPDSLRLQIRLDCNMIDLFLARLDALPMNFEQVCLTVAETQRVTHLLCASVDYIQIYKPRMDGLVERDPKDHDPMIMGTFVEDAMMLQHFFCARILVWMIQPLEEVAVYCIDVLTDIETLDSWLVLDQPRLKLRSVYTGAPNKAKYTAMNLFTRDHLGWANPFHLPSPVILTWPNAPLALLTREDVRFSPCEAS